MQYTVMKTIKLTILASDIMLNNYSNSNNCPITRALSRAGYPMMKDVGGAIESGTRKYIYEYNLSSYRSLMNKLKGMYIAAFGDDDGWGEIDKELIVPPADFEWELEREDF